MPSDLPSADDCPSTLPAPATNPATEALTNRLNRLRDGRTRDSTPANRDRRRGQPPPPPKTRGSGAPSAPLGPGRSDDPPSKLVDLVARLTAGLPTIDLSSDTLISPGEVVDLLPPRRRGRKAHKSTVFRWFTTGYKGLRLPFLQVGHQRCTSINALQSFLSALTTIARFEQGDLGPACPATPEAQLDRPTPGAKRHLQVEDELQRRHGI